MAYSDVMLNSNGDKPYKGADAALKLITIMVYTKCYESNLLVHRGVARLFAPRVSNHNGCP
jgi:hypothetical protein